MTKAFQILLTHIINIDKRFNNEERCNFCWKLIEECSEDHKDDIRQWILMDSTR